MTDIILQGPVFSETIETAQRYFDLDFVENVFISTWKSEINKIEQIESETTIQYIFSDEPQQDGGGNINYQIVSTQNGIKQCKSDIIVKTRSDQMITSESMKMMNRFFNKFSKNEITYEDGTGPQAPIFVIGMGSHFPYHPQDHVFWGYKNDIQTLFDIPPSTWPSYRNRQPNYTNADLRSPIYLGAQYYMRFENKIKEHFDNPQTFLLDASPKKPEAMELYNTIRDKVFKVFPRIDMYWEKYNTPYWYGPYEAQGEYYYDEPWE